MAGDSGDISGGLLECRRHGDRLNRPRHLPRVSLGLDVVDTGPHLLARGVALDTGILQRDVLQRAQAMPATANSILAEGVGFEPTVPFQARRFSRPLP